MRGCTEFLDDVEVVAELGFLGIREDVDGWVVAGGDGGGVAGVGWRRRRERRRTSGRRRVRMRRNHWRIRPWTRECVQEVHWDVATQRPTKARLVMYGANVGQGTGAGDWQAPGTRRLRGKEVSRGAGVVARDAVLRGRRRRVRTRAVHARVRIRVAWRVTTTPQCTIHHLILSFVSETSKFYIERPRK